MSCSMVRIARLFDCLRLRQFVLALVVGLFSSSLQAYEVSVDTVVANPGQRVAVPVRVDSVKGAANVGVRVTYDPQVLVLMKAAEGPLTKTLADDFVVAGDERNGSVFVAAFGKGDVAADIGGTLATLVFIVRDGTAGLYSDLAVSDVKIGEKTGVKDVTVDNPVRTKGGMVRVMSQTAAVERLEDAQVVAADARIGSLSLNAGDGIQASDGQTPVVVAGAVLSEGVVSVSAPAAGWADGRYEFLRTTSDGLRLALQGLGEATAKVGRETVGGVTTYFADVEVKRALEIACEGETLSAGAKNTIRAALEAAGAPLGDVKRVEVVGPSGNVALIADLGIAPAVGVPDETGTLQVTYAMPKLTITAFDPQTGELKIKVEPGGGNKIVSELATGYVHVYGTTDLAEKMSRVGRVGFDLTPYLKAETKGEATLTIELGAYSFLAVKVEE